MRHNQGPMRTTLMPSEGRASIKQIFPYWVPPLSFHRQAGVHASNIETLWGCAATTSKPQHSQHHAGARQVSPNPCLDFYPGTTLLSEVRM